jgi:hypothetical protein
MRASAVFARRSCTEILADRLVEAERLSSSRD